MRAALPTPTPAGEYEGRWRRALDECAVRGLDGLLAVSRGASAIDSYADVFYLCGHYGNIGFTPDFQDYWVGRSHSAVLLAPDREPLLIVDGADYRRDLVGIEDVRFALDFPAAVAGALEERGLARGRIGVCGLNVMSARVFGLLRDALPGCELLDADDLIEALRVIKSPFELERIRAAAAVGDEVVGAMMEAAAGGGGRVTEAQAVAEGYHVGIAAGVHFFDTSIASGPYSNYFTWNHLPSWSQRILQPGEIFHADSYGAIEGYLFDFGRTCIVSAPRGTSLRGTAATEADRAPAAGRSPAKSRPPSARGPSTPSRPASPSCARAYPPARCSRPSTATCWTWASQWTATRRWTWRTPPPSPSASPRTATASASAGSGPGSSPPRSVSCNPACASPSRRCPRAPGWAPPTSSRI